LTTKNIVLLLHGQQAIGLGHSSRLDVRKAFTGWGIEENRRTKATGVDSEDSDSFQSLQYG
jgi:hypothetical protein